MNLFIALAAVCFGVAFISGALGLMFAILISGDFKLGKPWFEYSLNLQDLKLEWHDKNKNKIKFFFKVAYVFFFFLAKAMLVAGFVFSAANYLRNL